MKSLKSLFLTHLVLWLAGPILITAGLLTGANLFDGLFGVYRNTPLQSFALQGGVWLTILGWSAAAVVSIASLFTTWRTSNKYALVTLVSVDVLLIAFVVVEIASH